MATGPGSTPRRSRPHSREIDGDVAIAVTSGERARDLTRRRPIVKAAASGSGPDW